MRGHDHLTSKLLFIAGACLLCCGLATFFARPRPRQRSAVRTCETPFNVSFLVFNTQASFTVFDPPSPQREAAAKDIIDTLNELHNTINAFDKNSELSALNDSAAKSPFKCSPLLWDLLLQSRKAWIISDGQFDATVGPLLHLWGFHAKQNKLPSDKDIERERAKVGFGKITIDDHNHTVSFNVPQMSIDFGGIAKGFALQLAVNCARNHGIQSFLINLGGNIFCSNVPPHHLDAFSIGIKNPRSPDQIVGSVVLADQCIATSGNYERYRIIQGQIIGHIMNPVTGIPVTPTELYEGVTAITTDPTLSDVFSTTAFVGGYETAEKLTVQYPGTSFIFVSFNGEKPVVKVVGSALFTPAP